MNIDQLKKQAKNLRKAFPDLVNAHGHQLTLAQAQGVIARINGYPSWEQLARKFTEAATFVDVTPAPSIASIIRSGLHFDVDFEPQKLPTNYSSISGNPTRYEWAHEAILRLSTDKDENIVRGEDESLYEFLDSLRGYSFDQSFTTIAPPALDEFETRIQASLERAPLNIEGYSLLTGVRHALGRYQAAVEASEPVVSALIDLLPKDRKVQVPYGYLANRPFFRLLHSHLLALDEVGRHQEADELAKLGLKLCPNDNIGFRYILTRPQRARADKT